MGKTVQEAQSKRIASLLQICQKAGKLSFGVLATERLISVRKARLVIYSVDLALRTERNIVELCQAGHVPYYKHGTKAGYGEMFGRRATGILTVKDENFARGISRLIREDSSDESMEV